MLDNAKEAPIVIGGTGGSGTRVVVTVLRSLGVFMGHTYDQREDSIPMGRFDRRWGKRLVVEFSGEPQPGPQHELVRATARFAFSRARDHQMREYPGGQWGWKHPHSYLFIPFLHERFPEMRFVHLVRNGMDMAISDNLGQMRRYGHLFVAPIERLHGDAAVAALFWSRANLHALESGTGELGDRYIRVRFEDLCDRPLETITDLAQRLRIDATDEALEAAARLPRRPSSAGRAGALPADVQAAMRELAQPGLRAFGYA